MKNLIKYLLLPGIIAFVSSCEVDRLPETQLTDAAFWRSESDLKSAANYLYTFLPGFTNEDNFADDTYGNVSNSISDGSRLVPATSNDYTVPYRLIRAANNIIEKAPNASATVTDAIIQRYIGEAKFFRAWAYFELFMKYGGVPLILKPLSETAPELEQPKGTREQVVAQIYLDLDEAIAVLPTPTTLGITNYGRVSKTAAQAFKARVALFEGTRAKFHNYGDPASHLTLAVASAQAVMQSGEHALYNDYLNLFQLAGEGRQNRELILVKQYGVNASDVVLTNNYARSVETGANNPTRSLVDAYLMKDGLPTNKSPLYVTPDSLYKVFNNRDPRMTATFLKRGDQYINNSIYAVPNLTLQRTGYTPKKYFNIDDWQTQQGKVDRILIRYAEVLLIYAEAKFEANNGTITDADLDLSINRLRTRAGMPRLTNAFVAANGLNMRDEIRRERRIELAVEGFRYWDLIRWKTAEVELAKPLLGAYYFLEFSRATAVKTDPNGYLLLQETSFRKFDPSKDYLFPFPTNELALNPGLVQNANWK